MMLPQSAQLGESALTLNETLVVAPRDAVAAPVPCPMPLAWPLPLPFESTGRAVAPAGGATGAAAWMGAAVAVVVGALVSASRSEWESSAPLGALVPLADAPSGA